MRYDLSTMWSLVSSRVFGKKVEDLPAVVSEAVEGLLPESESGWLVTIGWISAGLGAVAVGLFVGAELRQRYKFKRLTPYDFYAHSGGDERQEIEFGLGV